MKKTLPIALPLLTTFPESTHILSLVSERENNLPWIFDYYLCLISELTDNKEEFNKIILKTFPSSKDLFNYCPILEDQKLSREYLCFHNLDIINFLIHSIDQGYYVITYVDEYYLSTYDNYQRKHFFHPSLIYGYDSDDSTVLIADFFRRRKYSFEKVPLEEFKDGYLNVSGKQLSYGVRLVKKEEGIDIPFSEKRKCFTIINIKNYIESKNPFEWSQFSINHKFGINVYQTIETAYQRLLGGAQINEVVRALHIFSDHKKLILQGVTYFYKNNTFNISPDILEDLQDIYRCSQLILHLYMKYEMTFDKEILIRSANMLKIMNDKELKALDLILSLNLKSISQFELT